MGYEFTFTKSSIEKIEPCPEGRKTYRDSQTKGLYVEVRGDLKTFFYRRRLNGKLIVRYFGGMTLSKARQEVEALNGHVAMGKSITHDTTDITLAEAYQYYQSVKGYKGDIESRLKHVSHLMNTRLSALSKIDLKVVYDALTVKGKIATANCLLRYLSAIINLSIHDERYHGINPCTGFKKIPLDSRKVVLDKNEITCFIETLETAKNARNSDTLDALKLLVYTGQRKMNVLSMMWSELDFKCRVWTIPAVKFKGRRTQEVVLSKHALEILSERRQRIQSPYVFPVKGGKGKVPHMTELKKTFSHVKELLGIADLRIHDLRRSYGSLLLNEGVSIEVVSKILGHSSIAVTEKVYAFINRESVKRAVDVADSVFQR